MNRLFFIGTVALFTSGAHAALSLGLVAYYDFEESGTAGLANKASGALPGTNASWSSGTFGNSAGPGFSGDAAFNPGDGLSNRSNLLIGNALNVVDLNNQYMIVPLGTPQLGDTFTISAWTNLTHGATNSSARFHVVESSNSGVYDVSWGTTSTYSTSGRQNYVAYVENTTTPVVSGIYQNMWHHVALVYEPDDLGNPTVTVYVNGNLATTATDIAGDFAFTSLFFGRGRTGTSDDRDWDGLMDEVAIWNRALTPDEINDGIAGPGATSLYQRGLAGIAIPEPSMTLLGAVGMLALLRRRVGT
jgi:hypothetical protein